VKKMAMTVPTENTGRMHGGWETAGVVFVADDLGAWLVGLLADAGRKKLTTLPTITGSSPPSITESPQL